MRPHIIAFSKEMGIFKQLEIVANNIANANTSGFKADLAVYRSSGKVINNEVTPAPDMLVTTDLASGQMEKTDRSLDIAIEGDAYIQVSTPLGLRYTKNGSFTLNAENALVTNEGYEVQGDGGPITMNLTDDKVIINQKGEIWGDVDGVLQQRGNIQLYKFSDASDLKKVGNNFFVAESGGVTAEPIFDFEVLQGFIEKSNVNQMAQMTELVDITRSVGSLARIVQDHQQLLKSAVTKITGTS